MCLRENERKCAALSASTNGSNGAREISFPRGSRSKSVLSSLRFGCELSKIKHNYLG